MNPFIALALFSGIAVASAVFLAFYFLTIRQESKFKLTLLALLFLAISLRVAKSVIYYLTYMPDVGVAIGFIGLASIGPLAWLYIKYASLDKNKIERLEFFHFAPAAVGFFGIWLFNSNLAGYYYIAATIGLTGYLFFAWRHYVSSRDLADGLKKWNRLVLGGVTIIWLAFAYQHYSNGILDYAIGAAIASLVIYMLFFFALKNPKLFPKKDHSTIDPEIVGMLKEVLEVKKIYQRNSLTLNHMSEQLEVPAYVISKALKSEYGKSFPELINHFRINEVKERLASNGESFIKIEGLAYEVGFSTPSAFYAAFKKETSLSPGEYRKSFAS